MSTLEDHLYFIVPGATVPATATPATMGSKAYGLSRLARLGLPVPPAFVLGTAVCREYLATERLPEGTEELLARGLERLAEATGRQLGAFRRPLLVAVRSGAPVSMPGMMSTILNIGLCEATLPGLLRATGNPRQVRDCYRRVIRDFTEVVHGVPAESFDALAERLCEREGVASARELDSVTLGELASQSLDLTLARVGEPFPQDPMAQLREAVEAVFRSWNSDKAQAYRRLHHIDAAMGTAVTVQAMVFGNSGPASGSGVGFTRDPATGEPRLYLDFLLNAQGEDVVSGRHPVNDTARMLRQLPTVAAELSRVGDLLESELKDMQDFELTVENGRLYLLQTRAGKRTPWAAVRIATDMVREGRITAKEALEHLAGLQLDQIVRTRLADASAKPLASAVPASIGVASGALVFDARRAAEWSDSGRAVILARPDIGTDDIEGIAAAAGVLTTAGGRTSHAAVVARQHGKVCLVGCAALRIEADGASCVIAGQRLPEGAELTLDANAGQVYAGRLDVVRERPEKELAEVAAWRAAQATGSSAHRGR
jgi:pyruvate,orthophosphate dikinase